MANVLHSVQSRLKHRKVLGMGESADGNIPRSKICQLLGNDHLNHVVIEKADYPRGLRVFQWLTCIMFGALGTINFLYPQHFYRSATASMMDPYSLAQQISHDIKERNSQPSPTLDKNMQEELQQHFHNLEISLDMLEMPVRLYGTACLSLSALFVIVAVINRDNRRAIRIALFVEGMYFLIDILATLLVTNPLSTSNSDWLIDPASFFWVTVLKMLGALLCAYYYVRTHPSRDLGYKRPE